MAEDIAPGVWDEPSTVLVPSSISTTNSPGALAGTGPPPSSLANTFSTASIISSSINLVQPAASLLSLAASRPCLSAPSENLTATSRQSRALPPTSAGMVGTWGDPSTVDDSARPGWKRGFLSGQGEVVRVDGDRDVVEKCHDVMKSYVRVRPIRRWVPQWVRSHVYLCILGYFLRQLLKLKMDRGGVEMSAREALIRLRRLKLVTVSAGSVVLEKWLTVIDGQQEKLLAACGVVPT